MPEISGLYLQSEEGGEGGERKGSGKGKINMSQYFVVLISEMLDSFFFSCLF